jgi:hypothetical protein
VFLLFHQNEVAHGSNTKRTKGSKLSRARSTMGSKIGRGVSRVGKN